MKFFAGLFVALACAMAVGLLSGRSFTRTRSGPERSKRSTRRADWLAQSGTHLQLRQMRFVSAALFGFTFIVVAAATRVPAIALAPAFAAAGIPKMNIERARRKRVEAIRRAWPDGLRDVHASVVAGASLQHALSTMAIDGPEPLREPFRSFDGLARMIGVPAALDAVREDLADPISDRILEILVLAYERGGSIVVTILADLIRSATLELKLSEEIDAASLESRINARAVLVLPWAVLGFLCLGNADFRAFYASPSGALVVIAGAAASFFGAWLLRRLGAPQVEHRVFRVDSTLGAVGS